MDVKAVLEEYDAMFGARPVGEIEAFLDEKLALARQERDRGAMLSLLGEAAGLARNLRKRDKALSLCDELLALTGEMRGLGASRYATVLLNVGTAYSVFDRCEGAEALFREAEGLFTGEDGYPLASLYNNWSMLCVRQERFAESVELQKKALALIDGMDGMTEEKATSRSNIASILLRRYEAEGGGALLDEAECFLAEAMALYRRDDCRTFHYGTALITQGDLRMARGDTAGAAGAYRAAMEELESTIGRGAQYETAKALYERASGKTEGAT